MSYVGTHPTGRRYYARSKTGKPLAFAVFYRDLRPPSAYRSAARNSGAWQQVGLVEDRPHLGEMIHVDMRWIEYEGEMSPRVKAEQIANWWKHIAGGGADHNEVAIVELTPVKERG